MARKRMIDPNFWQSEDISKLSVFSRFVFIGMMSNADDEGKGRANTNYLKSIIFPYDEVRVAEVDKALLEISHNTSVQVYEISGNRYYKFNNWSKWQKVDHPVKSTIPDVEITPKTEVEEPLANGSRETLEEPRTIEFNIREDNLIKENINAREGLDYFSLIEIVKAECPILAKRHQALIDKGKIQEIADIEQILNEVTLNADEMKELFRHANKTYIVKPSKQFLSVKWVLSNILKVKETAEDNTKQQATVPTAEEEQIVYKGVLRL